MTRRNREWLLDRVIDAAPLMAACDSADDKKLQMLTMTGALDHYDCTFGNNYYHFTKAGRSSLKTGVRAP